MMTCVVLQLCRDQNRPMLLELFYQEDNYQDEANARVVDSYEEEVGHESSIATLTFYEGSSVTL